MSDDTPGPESTRAEALHSDVDGGSFVIDGQEYFYTKGMAELVLYNFKGDARYNHAALNPDSDSPMRVFSADPKEIRRCVSEVRPVGKERADAAVREAYWQFMALNDVELDLEDIEERDKVLGAQAERLCGESSDFEAGLASLLDGA